MSLRSPARRRQPTISSSRIGQGLYNSSHHNTQKTNKPNKPINSNTQRHSHHSSNSTNSTASYSSSSPGRSRASTRSQSIHRRVSPASSSSPRHHRHSSVTPSPTRSTSYSTRGSRSSSIPSYGAASATGSVGSRGSRSPSTSSRHSHSQSDIDYDEEDQYVHVAAAVHAPSNHQYHHSHNNNQHKNNHNHHPPLGYPPSPIRNSKSNHSKSNIPRMNGSLKSISSNTKRNNNSSSFQYSYQNNRNSVVPTPTMDNTSNYSRSSNSHGYNNSNSNGNSNGNGNNNMYASPKTSPMKNTIEGDFQSTPTSSNNHKTLNGALSPIPPILKERKTRVQVCVRVRPILDKDAMYFQEKPTGGRRSGHNTRHGSNSPSTRSRSSRTHKPPQPSSSSSISNSINVESMDPAWIVHPSQNQITQSSSTNPEPTRTQSYTFDHVFGPKDSTVELYGQVIQDSIFATMEGFHASVFAYGQTATGKTHTMTGPKSNPRSSPNGNSLGIIQLAIQDCFNYIYSPNGETREYLLRVSFMEIYNEVIYDLLADPNTSGPGSASPHQMSVRTGGSYHTAPPTTSIRIFESKNEGVVIRGLKEEIVTSPEQVLSLLALGEKRRQTGSTNLNKESSRSHSVFRITIESRHRSHNHSRGASPVTSPAHRGGNSDSSSTGSLSSSVFAPSSSAGPVRVSTLSLVDLAGSESVRNTGSTGMRKKEGQYINKSLLTLGHVIRKLSDMSTNGGTLDSTHIPYRDSKLTRILQQSLGGNAQISIICNVSPIPKHVEESHNTLKFATRAKRIKQTATITEVVDERTLLQNYREEIDELKRQLKEAKEVEETLRQSQVAVRPNISSAVSPTKETDSVVDSVVDSQAVTEDLDDDEETEYIVTAINNLERLILKTTTAEERKRKKKRKEEGLRGPPKMVSLGEVPSTAEDSDSGDSIKLDSIKPNNLSSGNLLDHDRPEDDFVPDDSLDSKFQALHNRFLGLNNDDDQTYTSKESRSIGDDSTLMEGKKLITELHRIQGLLGSVVARKSSAGVASPTPIIGNRKSLYSAGSPGRDEEVERLRAQLEEQAKERSLRQADSSFLQTQLQEKDTLLNEVSKILEAVEQRQVQLENENSALKQEFTKIVAQARQEELDHEKTMALMESKDSEIQLLRQQLGSRYG